MLSFILERHDTWLVKSQRPHTYKTNTNDSCVFANAEASQQSSADQIKHGAEEKQRWAFFAPRPALVQPSAMPSSSGPSQEVHLATSAPHPAQHQPAAFSFYPGPDKRQPSCNSAAAVQLSAVSSLQLAVFTLTSDYYSAGRLLNIDS